MCNKPFVKKPPRHGDQLIRRHQETNFSKANCAELPFFMNMSFPPHVLPVPIYLILFARYWCPIQTPVRKETS